MRRACNPRAANIAEAFTMVMVLPFVLGLVAALAALAGRRRLALGLGLVTVFVQVWWLLYHATDKLAVTL
jgi:hypothetical protein